MPAETCDYEFLQNSFYFKFINVRLIRYAQSAIPAQYK